MGAGHELQKNGLWTSTGDVSWVKSQLDAEGIPFPIELVMWIWSFPKMDGLEWKIRVKLIMSITFMKIRTREKPLMGTVYWGITVKL